MNAITKLGLMFLTVYASVFAATYFPQEMKTKFIYFGFDAEKELFQDQVIAVEDSIDVVFHNIKTKSFAFKLERKNKILLDTFFYETSIESNPYNSTVLSLFKVYKDTLAPLINNQRFPYENTNNDVFLQDNYRANVVDSAKNQLDIRLSYKSKLPYFKMVGVLGLGVVQMRYQKSSSDTTEWRNPCTDKAYRAELQAKSPGIEVMPCVLDTLPASAENPYHQSYYLRYIIGANGDTTFDYHRDIIKWAPSLATLKPQNPNIPQNVAGTWILPVGFEVQKVERILVNGSTEKLSFQIQNQKLFLSEIKNRNAVEWVRILPKNGVARTLRWE